MLHRGAEPVEYDALRDLDVPTATKSHVPIGHADVVEMVRYALGFFGHEIMEEHHAITEDGMRYFGLMQLRSAYGDYTDVCGLRNSHDKTFPIGISYGSQVFCCDNLAFAGDYVVKRRHTANSKRDLPGLVATMVEPLQSHRKEQAQRIEQYRHTMLTDMTADHAIMEMYRAGIVNVQRIAHVAQQWEKPDFEEWGDRTAWRLFNAATHALEGRVAENPAVTKRLHDVIDGVCTKPGLFAGDQFQAGGRGLNGWNRV